MKKLIIIVSALVFCLSSCRESTQEKSREAVDAIGEDIERNAEKIGEEIEQGAQQAGEKIEEGVRKLDRKLDKELD